MFRYINSIFLSWNTALVVTVFVGIALFLSEVVAVGTDYFLFGDEVFQTAVTALITTGIVSTPLIVLFVVTVKQLDKSKDRYRRMRDRALAESQSKSQFLANTSHELRTPLNAVLGFSQIMEQEVFGPVGSPKYKEYVRDIRRSGEHLISIIDHMLELVRIEEGVQKLEEEELVLGDVLDWSLHMITPSAESKGLKVRVSVPDTLPRLYADRRMLRQIMLNLLTNATKFTPAGGTISIEGGEIEEGGLWIRVADTGVGIAPEHLQKVLEPFGQIEAAETRQHGGLGLGLPLVKSMMELHGGGMWLTSEVNRGTTVHLDFPAFRIRRTDCPSFTNENVPGNATIGAA